MLAWKTTPSRPRLLGMRAVERSCLIQGISNPLKLTSGSSRFLLNLFSLIPDLCLSCLEFADHVVDLLLFGSY